MENVAHFEIFLQNEKDEVFEKLKAVFGKSKELEWELYEPQEDHFEVVAAFGKVFKFKKKNRKTIWKLAKLLLPTIGTIIANSFTVYLNKEPMECINVNKNENIIIIISEDRREDFECDKIEKAIKKLDDICNE